MRDIQPDEICLKCIQTLNPLKRTVNALVKELPFLKNVLNNDQLRRISDTYTYSDIQNFLQLAQFLADEKKKSQKE